VDPALRRSVAGEPVTLVAGGEPQPVVAAPLAGSYELPLVTNLFGTQRRVELAFGRRPERLLRRLVETLERPMPPSPGKLWQAHGPRTLGMHWQIGKGGGFHYAAAEARGEALPVTVFLGGPPALLLAAVAPLPENVPEMLLASLVAGTRLPRVPVAGGHPLLA